MSREFLNKFMLDRGQDVTELSSLFGATMQPVAQQYPIGGQAQPTQQPVATPQGGPLTPDMVVAGLIQRGIDPVVARASARELQRESGLDPSVNERNPIVPGSRGGYGLAQWTGPRRVAYESFAQNAGVPLDDPNAQLDFYAQELTGSEKAAYDAAKAAGNEQEAANILKEKFFRPASTQRQSYGDSGYGLFNQGGQAPNMADYQVPDQPDPRGFFAAINAALHGQSAPELDWRSALQGLGQGLSQLSHGETPDLSRIQDRQLLVNERNRAEYEKKRERAAAAQYAAANGDKASADALMSGGMELSQYFTKEQINDQRARWAHEDEQSAAGQAALYSYATDRLGMTGAAAGAFAKNPSAFLAGEQLRDARTAVKEAKQKEADTKDALAEYYGGQNDPESQQLAGVLRNPNISLDMVQQAFDISSGLKAVSRADRAEGRDTARLGLEIQGQQAALASQEKRDTLAQNQLGFDVYKYNDAKSIAAEAHKQIVEGLRAQNQPLAAAYAEADPSLSLKDAVEAAKQPAPPAVQQNYETAVKQGYTGTLLDYQINLARAAAANTTIDMKDETKWAEKMSELFVKSYDELQTSASQSADMLGNLDALQSAFSTGITTGFGGESLQKLRKIGLSLGIGDADKAAAGELVNSVANQLALQMRNPANGGGLTGSTSDADREFLKAAQANLGNSPEGNALIMIAARKAAERKIQIANMADAYIQKNGMLDPGFNQQVREFKQANPLFTADDLAQAHALATGVATEQAPAVDYNSLSDDEIRQRWLQLQGKGAR